MDTGGRTPIAFVDNNGYVTPFNGRVVAGLPGKYIYTKAELKFYLNRQREMEQFRLSQRFGTTTQESTSTEDPAVNSGMTDNPSGDVPLVKTSIVSNSYVPDVPPVPPIPPQAIAKPMDPTVPAVFTNVDPADKDSIPSGVNASQASKAVLGS